MPKDAITLLEEDHEKVNELFSQFEELKDEGDAEAVRGIVEMICNELLLHAQLEEQVFYPLARETLAEEETVGEAIEEHHVVENLITELQGMDPSNDEYIAKAIVLMEMVQHHVEEEEGEMFPDMREALDETKLTQIGEQMEKKKQELIQRIPASSN